MIAVIETMRSQQSSLWLMEGRLLRTALSNCGQLHQSRSHVEFVRRFQRPEVLPGDESWQDGSLEFLLLIT
jgi:hypothetical protein